MNRFCAFVAILCLIGYAAPAAGQITPGYQGDYDRARAQFRAQALSGFQRTLGEWVEAVNAGDSEAATRYYTNDAFVHLERAAETREDLRALLDRWLSGVQGVRLGLQDFDASGSMAYGSVRVQLIGSGATTRIDGVMAIAMRREGRRWAIRSQMLLLYPRQ